MSFKKLVTENKFNFIFLIIMFFKNLGYRLFTYQNARGLLSLFVG